MLAAFVVTYPRSRLSSQQFRERLRFPFNVVEIRINRNTQNLCTIFCKDECFIIKVRRL